MDLMDYFTGQMETEGNRQLLQAHFVGFFVE